jgi:ribosome assembly protein RRB1
VLDKRNEPKHKNDKFPMSVYMVAGSQAEKKAENKLYVMKWFEMYKTDKEDEIDSDMDSDQENEKYREPSIRFETIPHRGVVNRIRSMYGSPIVATWNEDAEVGIYNISQAVEELEKEKSVKKQFGGCKIASFKQKTEGYALDWSPLTYGRLASGSCDSSLWLYQAADETCSAFVKETAVGLQGHKGSIEDI